MILGELTFGIDLIVDSLILEIACLIFNNLTDAPEGNHSITVYVVSGYGSLDKYPSHFT